MTDREKVIRAVDTCFDDWLERHRWLRPSDLENVRRVKADALSLLKEQPEIIRCKDCRYGEPTIINGVWLLVTCDGVDHRPEWFCADGKRR